MTNAAKVRTLGQVELVIAFAISAWVLHERHTRAEYAASALVLVGVVGVVVLRLNAAHDSSSLRSRDARSARSRAERGLHRRPGGAVLRPGVRLRLLPDRGTVAVRPDVGHRRRCHHRVLDAVAPVVAVRMVGECRARQLAHRSSAVSRRDRRERADGSSDPDRVRPERRSLRHPACRHLPQCARHDGARTRQRQRGVPISTSLQRAEHRCDGDHRGRRVHRWRRTTNRLDRRDPRVHCCDHPGLRAANGSSVPVTSPSGTV